MPDSLAEGEECGLAVLLWRAEMMRTTLAFFFLVMLAAGGFAQDTPAAGSPVPVPAAAFAKPFDTRALDALLERAVRENAIPGAVAIVGHKGQIVYRKAFGWRSLEPERERMTLDTVFDMASLTKCMVTATAIMQLLEEGRLRLNDPVAYYLPEFGRNGKEQITIRQLATHFGGLAPDLELKTEWEGRQTAYRMANEETPLWPPGAVFRYSDVGFIVLGELVEKLSGMPLEQYAAQRIFTPLGMSHTRYLPPAAWLPLVAPTEYDEHDHMLRGVVHDPTARRMGGVAGHAGVFSTADNLALFAQALLDGHFVVSAAAVEKMTTPQQPPNASVLRGIGWDIDSPFSSSRGELLPVGSYGHTGFTGTSLWIDPSSDTYIILLTNAVHPHQRPHSRIVALRAEFANAVAVALHLGPAPGARANAAAITGYNETLSAERRLSARNGQVQTGIDLFPTVWEGWRSGRRPEVACRASPCRLGVLTNQTGLDSQGRRTIDVLAHLPGAELAAIFSPEHGVTGTLDTAKIGNTSDAATGVTVYSVYGATDAQRRPPPEVLQGLDAVIFDIQDAGVRWYTYETTLGYFLEACAQAHIPLIVLDRPNPITGSFVQGPMSESAHASFTNYHPLPVRHGMTLGELARLFNAERHIGADLKVVAMHGWQRGDWFDSTGLVWVNPSPNLRSLTEAVLYPGVAMVEGTNVSVGRGTDTPFELLGAPWMDARRLAAYLNARQIAGVRFVPVSFTPSSSTYANQLCHGIHLMVTDRNAFDAPELGLELASALMKLFPKEYEAAHLLGALANDEVFKALQGGEDPRRIADQAREALAPFLAIRQKYLLY